MCALILATGFFYPENASLTHYDFLAVSAISIQIILLATGMETWNEAKVILIYHIAGTAMKAFKTQAGSWVYPEESTLRIGAVPLLLGFMLVALFIWFTENIGTYAKAWAYPGQELGWRMVSIAKLGSWYLLMVISFVLVAMVNPITSYRAAKTRVKSDVAKNNELTR